MASGSTIYNFEIELSDTTRSLYESLSLRVAKHPSETIEYLLCRVLAYCLEYSEGIEFTTGLNDPVTPAIWVKDLTGLITTWVEIGAPSAEKIHKASKKVDRVVIYTHKNPSHTLQPLLNQNIFDEDKIKLFAFDPSFIQEIQLVLERRNNWSLLISDGAIYLDSKESHCTTQIQELQISAA